MKIDEKAEILSRRTEVEMKKKYFTPNAYFACFAEDVVLTSPVDSQDNNGSYNDWTEGSFGEDL